MKNNDKEFEEFIQNLKKQIPNEQVEKYALRRTQSDQLFRDHNELPFTLPPDNFYYQNTKNKNPYLKQIEKG